MLKFIAKHQDEISGVLSGFDRLVFRGTLRSIAYRAGMNLYLFNNQILLKDFGAHVEQVSQQLKTDLLDVRTKVLEQDLIVEQVEKIGRAHV